MNDKENDSNTDSACAENTEERPCRKTIYFNGKKLPQPQQKYVCWIDIMGIKNIMSESIQQSANFIFKLHIALLESKKNLDNISLYPLMDGAYILSPTQGEITTFLTRTLTKLAVTFTEEQEHQHRFLVRGALAFGPVYEGVNMDNSASRIFAEHEQYKSRLMVGLPIIQAFTNEKKAPPFSIYICESARAFAPKNEIGFAYRWFRCLTSDRTSNGFDYDNFVKAGEEYFEYARKNAQLLEYDKYEEHKNMFLECFPKEGLTYKTRC